MAVLNTDVGNSDALGTVAMGRDTTGGAIVLPDADISPDKVLWYSLQREDQERKKSQAAARQALSELNDIKVNGWANHLTELNQQKNDLLTKATSYLQKYRGKSWSEFNPRNPQQSKEALDIQKQLSQLKEMEAFSEQVKQWHQADVNAYKGKETNFDPESITQNTDFYKKPLSEAYQDFASTGERPMLEQAFPDWRTKAMAAAKSVGSTQQLTKREADGRIVTYGVQDVPQQENELAVQGFLHTDVGKQAVKDISKDHPDLNGDQIIDYFKSHYWDNFQNKKNRYEDIASTVGRKKEAAQWESSGNTIKNDKNIWSVYRKENGDTEVTISHTDAAANKPLTFMVGNENPIPITGTPVKIEQKKGKTPELLISIPKGYDYKQLTTKDDKVHLVQSGKNEDVLAVPYDDFSDVIKNEYGSGELDYYQALQRVKGAVGSTGTGGGKTETKSSGVKTADDFLKQYGQ